MGYPPAGTGWGTPHVNRQTDTCQNITFRRTSYADCNYLITEWTRDVLLNCTVENGCYTERPKAIAEIKTSIGTQMKLTNSINAKRFSVQVLTEKIKIKNYPTWGSNPRLLDHHSNTELSYYTTVCVNQ